MLEKLGIRKVAGDNCFNYWEVTGLTKEEMTYIEMGKDKKDFRDRLISVMDNHGNMEWKIWANGYGIYSVNRKLDPSSLIVETGSSCD